MTLPRGAVPKPLKITGIRSLIREDLGLLKESRATHRLARLRDPHHRLARLLASGLTNVEAAASSGYGINSVTSLLKDPGFQALVQHYRDVITESFKESQEAFIELATGNMLKAERMIAERLEEAEEEQVKVPLKDLLAISRDGADRLGYGKKQTNVNVNIDFAAKLEAARKRSAKVIDIRPGPTSPVAHGATPPGLSIARPESLPSVAQVAAPVLLRRIG